MNRITKAIGLIVAVGVIAAPLIARQSSGHAYPKTKTIDHVDNLHGTDVPDPYRWLEDDVRTSDEVAQWVQSQNDVTFAYLETIPERPLDELLEKAVAPGDGDHYTLEAQFAQVAKRVKDDRLAVQRHERRRGLSRQGEKTLLRRPRTGHDHGRHFRARHLPNLSGHGNSGGKVFGRDRVLYRPRGPRV